MGLPYDYTPAVLYALNKFSQGTPLTMACDQANITIAIYEKYVAEVPELQQLHDDAERRGHDALADALLQPDNHLVYGRSDAQMAKVMSDNIKWLLARRAQKKYGDKLQVQHSVSMDRVITAALESARERTALIDVTPNRSAAEDDAAIMAEILS